jgi:type I restriction enzyme M protein
MHWIAPSEKDNGNSSLEKRLWAAADQFRANSGLTAAQYSRQVLGLHHQRVRGDQEMA